MWLLPSRGRPHLVRRLFAEGFQTPGLLIIDDDDYKNYRGIELPNGWEKVSIPRTHLSAKLNYGCKRPAEWYGILNDDHLPMTPDWDLKLVEALKKQPMVWPQDNYGDRISTPVFDVALVAELGWIAPPELKHFYIDDVHELIADCLGCYRLEEVVVSHEHVNAGRMKPDLTWKERPSNAEDQKAFILWGRDKWPEIRKRIGC